jgi:hypothetical protein
MQKYIGAHITPKALQFITSRLLSPNKMKQKVTMKNIQHIYTLIVHTPYTPKEIADLTPTMTLKQVRWAIHLMLRYGLVTKVKHF